MQQKFWWEAHMENKKDYVAVRFRQKCKVVKETNVVSLFIQPQKKQYCV